MSTNEQLSARAKVLETEILDLVKQLKDYPEGKLVCYSSPRKGTLYHSWRKEIIIDNKKSRLYLPKEKEEEARSLAKKDFLTRLLNDKKNELAAVHAYLSRRRPNQYEKMLDQDSPYRELLINTDDWEYQPYEKSSDHPEHLLVQAPKDEKVRSKSEAMIAQALFNHQIPYRYEYVHDFGGYQIASDFTILHPKTNEEHIWEHFGLADDPKYINSNIAIKIPRYLMNGYLPGSNFIMTFEDEKHPLSYLEVEEIIQKYFLS